MKDLNGINQKELKKELRRTFDVPAPLRKKEFMEKYGDRGGTVRDFLRVQLFYIGKGTWVLMGILFLLSALAGKTAGYGQADMGSAVTAALMPFWVCILVREEMKSSTCRMYELELSCRHSLMQVMLARFLLLGAAELVLLCLTGVLAAAFRMEGFLEIILYILVPWMMTSCLSLWLIKKTGKGNETWYCLGAAVFVSAAVLVCGSSWPWIYSGRSLGLWAALFVLLLGANIKAVCGFMQNMEEYLWNLN